MNNASLCASYAILVEAIPFFEESIADVDEIKDEAKHADAELSRDLQLFGEWLDQTRKAVSERDVDNIGNALVHLRGFAMNIASNFRNLADAIEQTAFRNARSQKEAGRYKKRGGGKRT